MAGYGRGGMVWFTIHNTVCILSFYLTNLLSMVITSETNSHTGLQENLQ